MYICSAWSPENFNSGKIIEKIISIFENYLKWKIQSQIWLDHFQLSRFHLPYNINIPVPRKWSSLCYMGISESLIVWQTENLNGIDLIVLRSRDL